MNSNADVIYYCQEDSHRQLFFSLKKATIASTATIHCCLLGFLSSSTKRRKQFTKLNKQGTAHNISIIFVTTVPATI